MELMVSQKNQLLEIVKNFDIDPFNFKWHKDDSGDEIASLLKYKDTEYLFGLKIYPAHFKWVASPGEEIMYESSSTRSWDEIIVRFHRWLGCLEREISQPDLWEELEKIKLFDVMSYEDDVEFESKSTMQEFTYREVLQIEQGINDIRNYIVEEVKANTEEMKIANEKLDYLIDATKRMGRIDWKNLFLGVIIDLMLAVGIDPTQRKVLGQLAQNTVSGIIKLLPFK